MRWTTTIGVLAMLAGAALPTRADLGDDAFTMWVKHLTTSRQAAERVEAAESLGRQGRPDAVAPLAQALADPAPEVRAAAAAALWNLGDTAKPAVAALWQALGDADPRVVVQAAGALEALDADTARLVEPRRRALASGDLSVRFLAARGLIGHEPPASLLPPVLDYLDRQAERRRDPKADSRARDAAEHNQELAEKALARLVGTQDRTLVAPLVERVGRDHPAQAAVLQAMGGLDPAPDGWDELLSARMGSREAATRMEAADLARRRTLPAQAQHWVPAAVQLLADADDSVRSAAMWAIGSAGGLAAEAVPALVERLAKETDTDRRRKAAEVLGDVGDHAQPVAQAIKLEVAAKARPALEKTIAADPESSVRKTALHSLDRLALEPSEIVAILSRVAASSRDDDLTWAALQALRNRGFEAAPALEMIRSLQHHGNPQVADYATIIARELAEEIGHRPGGAAPPAAAAAASSAPRSKPATAGAVPDPGAEASGLAVLRARGEEFTEAAYMRALMNADAELVGAYVDAGMSPDLRFAGADDRRPLHLLLFSHAACDPGVRPTAPATFAIVESLLARGADANAADARGNTPLMFAADKCDGALLGKLLAAGARVGARNVSGLTALEMTIWSANDGLEVLIGAGARLSAETAAAYREAYKANPKAIALIDKATQR